MFFNKPHNTYIDEPASQLYKLYTQLDALNLELADKEQRNEPVVGPWDPSREES